MSDGGIQLSASVRQNVTQLNRVQTLLQETQQNLSTGKDVNSALDDPQNFFQAKSLNDRADSLLSLKDQMGQGISAIESANEAASTIDKLIGQAEGLANSALNNLGTGEDAAQKRASLASDFNEVISQIDKVAQDAGYQGKNLAKGSGKEFGGVQDSLSDLNSVSGISAARTTNVQDVTTARIEVKGDGNIDANSSDIAEAQQARGLKNLKIGGLNSKTDGSFEDVSIKVEGGDGADKTITVSQGGESSTLQFDRTELKGREQSAFVKFDSGTSVSFDVNLEKLESAKNAGQGTSKISLQTDLAIEGRDNNGLERSRSAANLEGNRKLKDGEQALQFTNTTVRFEVDQNTLQSQASFESRIGDVVGSRSDAVTEVRESSSSGYTYAGDTTYQLNVTKTAGASFDVETGSYDGYNVTLEATAENGKAITATSAETVTATNTQNISFTGVNADSGSNGSLLLDFNFDKLSALVESSAADSTSVEGTFERLTGSINSGDVAVTTTSNTPSVSGFQANTVSDLKFTVTGTGTNASGNLTSADVFVEDGNGGVASASITANTATTATFNFSGGPNDGAEIALKFDNLANKTTIGEGDKSEFSYSVRGEFTGEGSAEFTTREQQQNPDNSSAAGAQFVSTELKSPSSGANDLRVDFNADRSNFINVESQNLQTNGTGLAIDEAQNKWFDRADVERSLDQLRSAKSELESAQTTFSTSLNIVKTRENFSEDFANKLQTGADKLTLADQNKEAAELTTLQTRQQLGIRGLSIANQSQQAVLSLF